MQDIQAKIPSRSAAWSLQVAQMAVGQPRADYWSSNISPSLLGWRAGRRRGRCLALPVGF